MLLGAAALVVAALGIATVLQARSLNRQIINAEQDLAPLRVRLEERRVYEQEHRQFTGQLKTIQTLREPLPPAAIIALLTRLAPDDVVVKKLVIEVPPPLLVAASDDRRAGNRRADAAPFALVQIEGLASVNETVPLLIRRLMGSGVFGEVQLDDSQKVLVNGASGQRFRISAQIPLISTEASKRIKGEIRR